MRDFLRRLTARLFPPADPDAIAALDGGPGPEPVADWNHPDADPLTDMRAAAEWERRRYLADMRELVRGPW